MEGEALVVGRRGARHACIGKERAIRPFRHGNFGVDVGAAFLIVALGKRPPMPYVWLPRCGASRPRAARGVRSTAVFRKNGGSA